MGMDIHISVERKTEAGYEPMTDLKFSEGPVPFDWRYYGMFGFLCGEARNWSQITPLSAEARGVPEDASDETKEFMGGYIHCSWLSVEELFAFDYDQMLEDRRCMIQTGPRSWSGAGLAPEGEGVRQTYREFLGPQFLEDVRLLREYGADRIVFGFDC